MKRRKKFLLIFSLLVFFFATSGLALDDTYWAKDKKRMIENDLKGRDITDKKVLMAMENVPRHRFVSGDQKRWAYADRPLPIGEGQTISQPYIVALMTQLLSLKGNEKVLEIGTGSGYQAAILAELVKEVYTVEIIEILARRAEKTLKDSGYKNIKVKTGDGYFGWKEHSLFDVIIVTCAPDHFPPHLIEQLKEGGKMVIPVGPPGFYQTLWLVEKREGKPQLFNRGGVAFVPMTGAAQKKK